MAKVTLNPPRTAPTTAETDGKPKITHKVPVPARLKHKPVDEWTAADHHEHDQFLRSGAAETQEAADGYEQTNQRSPLPDDDTFIAGFRVKMVDEASRRRIITVSNELTLTVQDISAPERLDIYEACGGLNTENRLYLGTAIAAAMVRLIERNGKTFAPKFPATNKELKALLHLIGNDGLSALETLGMAEKLAAMEAAAAAEEDEDVGSRNSTELETAKN